MRKMKMGALLAALSGATLFGGCLGGWLQMAVKNLPGAVIAQFLTDNDGFLDLIPDETVPPPA